jgi:hypothetical protein
MVLYYTQILFYRKIGDGEKERKKKLGEGGNRSERKIRRKNYEKI